MADDPHLPFGDNTLKLRAVFVPDGAQVSMADIIRVVGPHPVTFRAVWAPLGSALPGYPYEHIGNAVFIPDSDAGEGSARVSSRGPGQTLKASAGSAADWSTSSWAPRSGLTSDEVSISVVTPRQGVRSTQANFSAAVPSPDLDRSREAIDAAVQALAASPDTAISPQPRTAMLSRLQPSLGTDRSFPRPICQ